MGDIMAVLSECQRRFGRRVDQSQMPDRYSFGTLSFKLWEQSYEGEILQKMVDEMKCDSGLIKVALWKCLADSGEPAFSLQRTAEGDALVFDTAKVEEGAAGSTLSSGQQNDRPDPDPRRSGRRETLKRALGSLSLFRTRNRKSTD